MPPRLVPKRANHQGWSRVARPQPRGGDDVRLGSAGLAHGRVEHQKPPAGAEPPAARPHLPLGGAQRCTRGSAIPTRGRGDAAGRDAFSQLPCPAASVCPKKKKYGEAERCQEPAGLRERLQPGSFPQPSERKKRAGRGDAKCSDAQEEPGLHRQSQECSWLLAPSPSVQVKPLLSTITAFGVWFFFLC